MKTYISVGRCFVGFLKIKKPILIVFFVLLSITSVFAQQSYKDCIELEKQKAEKEGSSFSEAVDYAEEFCIDKRAGSVSEAKSDTKHRFFIGVVPPFYAGNGEFSGQKRETRRGGSTGGPFTAEEEIDGGRGFKFGFRFPQWRVSYNQYDFDFDNHIFGDNLKAILSVLVIDWVHSSGIFIGGGLGSGAFEHNGFLGSNEANIFNIGYNHTINENFSISGGYLYSSFKEVQIKETVTDINITEDEINVEIDAIFSVATIYTDLIYTF